jgi:hypothetical protein
MRRSKSKTRAVRLGALFPGRDIDAKIARVCVLYEDLRYEITQAEKPLTPSERFYYYRRSLATVQEISSAILCLNGSPDFKKIKEKFPKSDQDQWKEAIQAFQDRDLLGKVRSDIGGHFQEEAARHGVLLSQDETGLIECERKENDKGQWKLLFTLPLTINASTRHGQGQNDTDKFLNILTSWIKPAIKHAIKASQVLCRSYLWPRSGL